ncbi:hypothetical protein QCD70_19120, partial [Agreia sp. PsM10]|uniref:hypothetical protein n=1 Tax=Agreia sp. PsM10 TaxID=3030533 RepID=UPI00263B7CF7
MINAAMQEFNPEFAKDNLYENAVYILTAAAPPERSCITLENYPTSQRLSDLYVATEDKNIIHLLNTEKSGRRG